jgi:hypothetical protein
MPVIVNFSGYSPGLTPRFSPRMISTSWRYQLKSSKLGLSVLIILVQSKDDLNILEISTEKL